ncbi:MAG: ABC transporter ATP-binding protein [Clostridiales bacterium]|jgi:lipopolysaccharide transport system ATP-binding protein|nr:ABC transporter ATP-binding protein [Clostridiales bacterium]
MHNVFKKFNSNIKNNNKIEDFKNDKAEESDYIIKVQSIHKFYRLYKRPLDRLIDILFFSKSPKKLIQSFCALSDINFIIKKGETVGIIGRNGSGKSTILKILAGILVQSSGTINIKGKVSALLELGAGFNPDYTGIQNIYLNGMIYGLSRKQIDERITEILNFAEIGDFAVQPVRTYSSGMFVRLAFASAISVEPEILIVDEALSVGDYRFQAKCYKKFETFKKSGKTILFVTHDIDAVRRFCTRAIWIDKGEKILDGEVLYVTSKYMEFVTNNTLFLNGFCENKDGTIKNFDKDKVVPINRFGSNIGLIKSVESYKNDVSCLVFLIGDFIEVKIILEVPDDIDRNIAVSLGAKNKAGLDLFVLSTFDKGILLNGFQVENCSQKNVIEVIFKFPIFLNVGEYVFVASLENRSEKPIVYYDYIEGALYFKVISEKEHYGIFNVLFDVEVKNE